jgi:hypothetical protein
MDEHHDWPRQPMRQRVAQITADIVQPFLEKMWTRLDPGSDLHLSIFIVEWEIRVRLDPALSAVIDRASLHFFHTFDRVYPDVPSRT